MISELWSRFAAFMNPPDEENDPKFAEELERVSTKGVRVVTAVSVAANVLAYLLLAPTIPTTPTAMLLSDLFAFVIFAVIFALSYQPRFARYARPAGLSALFLVTIQQFVLSNHYPDFPVSVEPFVPAMMAITLLLAIACFPTRPLQTLAIAFGITVVFFRENLGGARFIELPIEDAIPATIMIIAGLVGTALTGVVYRRRAEAFRARRLAEVSLEALQDAQARLVVSENAASQTRLASALCHELNTPLGALASALDTMGAASRKLESSPGDERIRSILEAAERSGRESMERLRSTIARMKHVTNLDRADEQSLDLNELWKDTVGLLDESIDATDRVALELAPLPRFIGQPQKLGTVFANLLQNAVEASASDAGITIATFVRDDEIVMEVRDHGCGITEEKLAHLFEPGFRKDGGRVSTTNWGLFVSRGIVTEHGGHLEIESRVAEGTVARVLLPTGRAQ